MPVADMAEYEDMIVAIVCASSRWLLMLHSPSLRPWHLVEALRAPMQFYGTGARARSLHAVLADRALRGAATQACHGFSAGRVFCWRSSWSSSWRTSWDERGVFYGYSERGALHVFVCIGRRSRPWGLSA